MKYIAITLISLAAISCSNFDANPSVTYDPVTGKWTFAADVTPVVISPAK